MLLEEETKTRREREGEEERGVEYTPDSDLAQSTHPFPIIQNDTVEERLREKGSWRKGWESVKTRLLSFIYALFPHTQPKTVIILKE